MEIASKFAKYIKAISKAGKAASKAGIELRKALERLHYIKTSHSPMGDQKTL